MYTQNLPVDAPRRRQRLDDYFAQAETVILSRQDPITGLLPASTAITVHGDYTHAWVRDNVYSILAVWGLALAYRREDDDNGRAYRLEQSVVKLMRGLLTAMLRQAPKVERFKQTQAPLDALHAKYDTRTGAPVVDDDAWGHLQLDATSLFLLMLAQMTASGLRIVFTLEEVAFIQNLVHYLSRAYHTPDYGIWERGDKMNEGEAEINASSVGMVKAALEALRGFDLFGGHGGQGSKIHVPADAIARARGTLETLLPRESNSKETDAALLSVIGFPAFAVEDPALVQRVRQDIVSKLQGRYGCKRFLRDGHQTVVEDHGRLHYQTGELSRFEHIESEWPLFFTYLLLDGVLRRDAAQAQDYRDRLEPLLVERDGAWLLPELYYVPADHVQAEKAAPGSQERLPNANVPLVWAQSLYLLGTLLHEGYIHPADVDPLSRRWRVGLHRETPVQITLLAENPEVQARLLDLGIAAQMPEEIAPVQLRPAVDLAAALAELGRCPVLGLSGRPDRPLGSLVTSQVFSLAGQDVVFLPPFLEQRDFYLALDNRLLAEQFKAELAYVHRHWDQPGQPLMALLITDARLHPGSQDVLIELMKDLQAGACNGVPVRVKRLAEHLPTAGRERIDNLGGFRFATPPLPLPKPDSAAAESWDPKAAQPLSPAVAATWRRQTDNDRLLARLEKSANPYEQVELLGLLWERLGPDQAVAGSTVRALTEALYTQAARHSLWGVLRRAAAWLDKVDPELEDAVAELVTHQHQLAVGRAYSRNAVIRRPLGTAEITGLIRDYGGDDPRGRVLIQEIVLYLGMLIKADPTPFKGTLTLRAWYLLLLIISQLAREKGLAQDEAFETLLELSPHTLLARLHRVLVDDRGSLVNLNRVESLHRADGPSGLIRVGFSAAADPGRPADGWKAWREVNGVITRLPEDFHPRVWGLLRHCQGLLVGDRLDVGNRLDSETVLADMTAAEKNFALRVDNLLNGIAAPEFRQLTIEALLALSVILQANPELKIDDPIVTDVLIGHAVRQTWQKAHPRRTDYNEHSARAWEDFYALPPHQVATALQGAFAGLLESGQEALEKDSGAAPA